MRTIRHVTLPVNFFLITMATSVNVLFGFFKFANALNIRFYYFHSPKIVNIDIFSPSIDFWIWALSLLFIIFEMLLTKTLRNPSPPRWTFLPGLLALASLAVFSINDRIAYLVAIPLGFVTLGLSLYYGNGYQVTSREEAVSLTLLCITGLLVLFEVGSASTWAFNTLYYEAPFGPSSRWELPLVDLQLFNVLYPLTSWLFLAFLYSWIWIPALKYMLTRIRTSKQMFLMAERKVFSPIKNVGSELKLNNKFLSLGLLLSVATAAFLAYYPCIRLPSSALAGADSIDYYDSLKEMAQKGPATALEKDRPIFNLLIYAVNYAVGSPETVIRIIPIILAVSLSLAVFWFVKVGTGNERIALMSSLLSAFSFQTTVSVFAYIAANWLAIIETLLLMVFFLKSLEKHSRKYMLTSALIGIAVLLTHPYTWNVMITVLATYSLWSLLRKRSEKTDIAAPIFLLATNLIFYLVYSLMPLGKGVSSAEEGVLDYVISSIGLSSFLNLQNSLASMVQTWAGGLFANPLLIILAIAGVFPIMNFAKRFNRLMLVWVLVPSVALLATPPDLYSRIIYLIPMQILAASGLYWILDKLEDSNADLKTSDTFHALKISIITLVLLFLLNYALRSADGAVIQMFEP